MDINKQSEVQEEPSEDNPNVTLRSWMESQESVIAPTPLTRQESVASPTPLMRYDTIAAPTFQGATGGLMRYDTIIAPTPLTRQPSVAYEARTPLTRQTTTGFVNPSLLRRTYDEPSNSPPYHDAFYQPLEDQIRELRKQINEMSDKLDNVISNMH